MQQDINNKIDSKADQGLTIEQINKLAELQAIANAELQAKASIDALASLQKQVQSALAAMNASQKLSEQDLITASQRAIKASNDILDLKEQWNFTFTELKSITEMLDDPINNLKVELGNVTSEVENMNIKISALPGVWQKATDAVNNYSNAAKKASKYSGGGGYVTGGNDNNKTETKNPETEINEYIGWVGKTLEFRADNNSIDTYNSDGTKTGKKAKDPWGYDPNVKILGSKNIPGVGYAFLTDEWTGYVPVKYFYNTGIGGKKIGKSYKTGGMVDYTGPAWVDGTKSSPEAFLNSYQTQQVGALADALSNNSVSSVTGDSNITFGSISFNVASMSSSADGKAALETFVKGANDLMAKKGISTTLNLNVK